MTDARLADGTLAGYRLVRTLARGSRADVYLGAGSSGSVALKVFVDGIDTTSVHTELDALGRLESPHLVRLLDVSSDERGLPILVLERVRRGSLAALLKERDELELGELVTLLAPLAHLTTELHAAGIAHGRIGATAIHLGSAGEPVLLGLGHASLFAAGSSLAALDDEPSARTDREALAALTLAVLERVRGTGADPRARDLRGWLTTAPRVSEFGAQLEERLFASADPLPVSLSSDVRGGAAVPARIGLTAAQPASAPEPASAHVVRRSVPPPADSSTEGSADSSTEDSGLAGWLPLIEHPGAEIRRRLQSHLRGVRTPFWIVAGAIVAALVVAIAVIPGGGSRTTATDASARPITRASSSPLSTPVALPSDPVLALPILLTTRTTCFRDLSVLCLDSVDEGSSAAFDSDTAAIQRVQQGGGEIPSDASLAATAPTLAERLGDSAIVSLGPNAKPASVLMIRTEAGWRIRDYLSGVQATGSSAAPSGD